MRFKGRSSGRKESKVNSCDSISDDESVGSCDNHARGTPRMQLGSGIKGFMGSLKLKEGAKLVFMKDRPVPCF